MCDISEPMKNPEVGMPRVINAPINYLLCVFNVILLCIHKLAVSAVK